jgi:hypothetical protein
MALFSWQEITTKAWIFSLALFVLVVWFAWPVIETSGRLIQLLWVVYTNEWTDGF